MRMDRHLIACAATALLYFAAVVGIILYQPKMQARGVTAEARKLSGSHCEDARVLIALLAHRNKQNQICAMTDPERQAYFRTLMRDAIY